MGLSVSLLNLMMDTGDEYELSEPQLTTLLGVLGVLRDPILLLWSWLVTLTKDVLCYIYRRGHFCLRITDQGAFSCGRHLVSQQVEVQDFVDTKWDRERLRAMHITLEGPVGRILREIERLSDK